MLITFTIIRQTEESKVPEILTLACRFGENKLKKEKIRDKNSGRKLKNEYCFEIKKNNRTAERPIFVILSVHMIRCLLITKNRFTY